jgi:integrase
MAILAECPMCRRKQATQNKFCSCGEDLDKAKRSKRVKYWIAYRLPGGKQRRELVGYSIEEARDAEGKRRSQKRENRIFDIKPEAKMTFGELSKWYLELDMVRALKSYWRAEIALERFNSEYGDTVVSRIKPVDLENLQAKWKARGYRDATIDQNINMTQTMIIKAFDNDMVSGDTLKAFKKVKRLLRKNANARDRVLAKDEFERLKKHAPRHAREIIVTGYYTGMRLGEILSLTWDKVDLNNRLIRLEAADTKDKEARNIPICDELYDLLRGIARGIHDNHVFLRGGKSFGRLDGSLKTACKKAGIPYGRYVKDGFVFHDLRHTFNTNMRKAGVPESVIMEITGHSTREMFDRYNTIDTEDVRKGINQLERYLEQSVDQNVDQPAKYHS